MVAICFLCPKVAYLFALSRFFFCLPLPIIHEPTAMQCHIGSTINWRVEKDTEHSPITRHAIVYLPGVEYSMPEANK
jgi:hypothetical protein